MSDPAYSGKVRSSEFRRYRAKQARAAQSTPDYFIRKLVESASALTPEQAQQLRALLPPGGGS